MKKGYSYAFLSVVVMVGATVLNSIYIQGISNMSAAFINTITVLSVLGIQRVCTKKKIIHRRISMKIILMGVFNLIGLLCMFEAVRLLGASSYAFVSRLSIIFSLLIGILILNEKTKISYLGIVLTLVGIVVMQFSDLSQESLTGIFVTVIFTLCISISNALAKVESEYSADEKLLYNSLVCIIPLSLYMIASKEIMTLHLDYTTLFVFIGTSILSGFLGMKFYFLALKTVDFSTVTIIRTISPVLTLVISDVILKLHPITERKLWGGLLILIGILLVVKKKLENKKSAPQ